MLIEKTASSRRMEMCVRSNQNMGKLLNFDKAEKANWKLIRLIANISYALVPKAKGVKIRKVKNGDFRGYCLEPEEKKGRDIVLCIHGGGMLCGSAYGSLGFSGDIAKKSGLTVYVADYALAPEDPFPKGVDDVYRAYTYLLKQHPDSKVFVTGESAGGYLTIVLTAMAITNGIPVPQAIFPHCPVIDFSGALDRSYYEVHDKTISPNALNAIADVYCPDEDRKDFRISPYYFDSFDRFPPTYISADANEYLRGDADKLYEILTKNDVETRYYRYKNTYHGFAVTGSITTESDEILNDFIDLMRKTGSHQ